jgi:hypothetical protein
MMAGKTSIHAELAFTALRRVTELAALESAFLYACDDSSTLGPNITDSILKSDGARPRRVYYPTPLAAKVSAGPSAECYD